MFSKKKFLLSIKISGLMLILLILIEIIPITLSRYQSSGVGKVDSNIAFYLFKVDHLVSSIKLTELLPSDTPYIYNFSVGNQKEDKISEVDIEYLLSIVTTTNLPLKFELYENCNYLDNSCLNLLNENNKDVSKDEDGTYFQKFSLEKEDLYYENPQTNEYTLVIYFDKINNDFKYHGVVESVRIEIDSKQMG